ncbi:hypothetical protein CHO01_39360 [Cellulomonas hominis]|uniref:Fluoride-specific ion channel FluC n=1 Tax=Cellulomonas hominis TaxID=156981 RepID=A0A511FHX5_9CELL|nr:CrcB family protein [Cellulomonas hominis]MBB5475109.1 CrcB protein [Cellulomonas hominis]NKY06762.1 CrcB family protein [Cellulomonas hominis]GEL48820.1 hypothetical protein CHO01_39360 [Cellulomonas hominis]
MAVLVAAGATLGTTARATLESTFAPTTGAVPWVTFGINITGSFLLGALLQLLTYAGPDTGWRRTVRLGCGTGVIGGFTTYSTFILEIDQLARGGNLGAATGYMFASVSAGLAAALVAIAFVNRVAGRRSVVTA